MHVIDHLKALVEKQGPSSFDGRFKSGGFEDGYMNPATKHICNCVSLIREAYGEDCVYASKSSDNAGRNIVALYFEAEKEDASTIAFSAHHDIVNPKSDNVFDNLASVAHLLSLAYKLAEKKPKHQNVLLLFTDGEEVGGLGAQWYSNFIVDRKHWPKVVSIVNLELTAAGTHYWVDKHDTLTSYLFKKAVQEATSSTYLSIGCPFNDAYIYRKNGIDSSCVGTITRSTVQKIKDRKCFSPAIWSICHTKEDLLAKASASDMEAFNKLLAYIAYNDWSTAFSAFEKQFDPSPNTTETKALEELRAYYANRSENNEQANSTRYWFDD